MATTGDSGTNYSQDAHINWLKGSAYPSPPATLYVGLFTVTPGDGTAGTEASYAGYARQAITLSAITHLTSGSQVTNTNALNFAGPPAGGTYTAFGFFDALTTGNLLEKGTFTTPLAVAAAQPIYFAPGDLSYTED